jgi:hypothetical protein
LGRSRRHLALLAFLTATARQRSLTCSWSRLARIFAAASRRASFALLAASAVTIRPRALVHRLAIVGREAVPYLAPAFVLLQRISVSNLTQRCRMGVEWRCFLEKAQDCDVRICQLCFALRHIDQRRDRLRRQVDPRSVTRSQLRDDLG